MRIVSLLPSATETAFALGLGEQVVGVTAECDYPPEARRRPIVSRSTVDTAELTSMEIDEQIGGHLASGASAYRLDMELLQQLSPDLILTQELCDVCAVPHGDVRDVAGRLSPTPTVLSLDPHSLSDVLDSIRSVAAATGREAEAQKLVVELRARAERVQSAAATVSERPRVLCLEWLDPPWVAGHWMPELVVLAGGEDGLGEVEAPSRRIDWRAIQAYSPKVVVLMPCGFDVPRTLSELKRMSFPDEWESLPAVKRDRVYVVDGSAYLNRPGPRIVDGLEILAEAVHPDLFEGLAPEGALVKLAGKGTFSRTGRPSRGF